MFSFDFAQNFSLPRLLTTPNDFYFNKPRIISLLGINNEKYNH